MDKAFDRRDETAHGEVVKVLRTRVWYDSAALTFPRQVSRLMEYGVPAEQFGMVL